MLSILNDDCLYHVLKWLPLPNLCVCSRTCKRLQELCENQFHRKYGNEANKEVQIRCERNGQLRVSPFNYHIKYFHNSIKNLTIGVTNIADNEELILSVIEDFIKSKCDQNLYKICIGRGNMELVSFCERIGNYLRNVQVVQMVSRFEIGQAEATFLKHCPNITKLILTGEFHAENLNAILQQKYNQLEQFHYLNGNPKCFNPEILRTFFRNNDRIQCVTFDFWYCGGVCHAVQCIKAVDCAPNLERLLLSLGQDFIGAFDDICNYLHVLCDRNKFKSLELEFRSVAGARVLNIHANQLAKWKQLTKIHMKHIQFADMIPALLSLVNLKTIVLEHRCLYHKYHALVYRVNNILVLPQVEEIQIDYTGVCDESDGVQIYVEEFVSHWMNLKRILLPSCHTNLDIFELNRARETLKNACELTIFTDHKANETTDLDHKLVKLKFVEFESDFDECPFQKYCLP